MKDKPISSVETSSSFWASPKEEQVTTQPPTPTKDSESQSFTF